MKLKISPLQRREIMSKMPVSVASSPSTSLSMGPSCTEKKKKKKNNCYLKNHQNKVNNNKKDKIQVPNETEWEWQ
jgi:hypothetical protein